MSATMGVHLRYAGYGLLLGFCLSRMGFSSYDEVHKMFVFSDLRLFLTFVGGVSLSMAALFLMRRLGPMPPRPLHPGVAIGGVLFGIGWAVTGACPGVVLVQLGEGQLPAAITFIGVLCGAWLYPRLHARFFRWDTGTCEA